MVKTFPTGLAQWLHYNRLSVNKLAKQIGASPHAIGNLAKGNTQSINKDILDAVARRTQLSYERIIKSVEETQSPTATGDLRIDLCLGLICKYLHSPEMRDKCRRYFSLHFSCSGRTYADQNLDPVGYDEMCVANTMEPGQITSSLISVSWFTPSKLKSFDSRILHTYWRALHAQIDNDLRYDDTFVVVEFEQSVNEMSPIDIPKIKSWWWDQPSEFNRVPVRPYQNAARRKQPFVITEENEEDSINKAQ